MELEMIGLKYAYLAMVGVFALVWTSVFLLRPRLQRRMLIVSVCTAPFGPVAELFHVRDYWQPMYVWNAQGVHIEDVLAAFLAGGLGSVLFDAAVPADFRRVARESMTTVAVMVVGGWATVLLLTLGLGVNSVTAMTGVSFTLGTYMVIRRTDLLIGALANGALFAALLWISYSVLTLPFPHLFTAMWMLQNLSGMRLGRVPVEELVWGFAWGMVAWPIYPFFAGLRRMLRSEGTVRLKATAED